jgi:tryptophan-rich sensory protein
MGVSMTQIWAMEEPFGYEENSMSPREQPSSATQGTPGGGGLGTVRPAARIAVVIGAAGSIALMLRVGQRNPSSVLMLLFAIWVLSPFVALALAEKRSQRWSPLTRAALHGATLIVTVGSLAVYGVVAFGPPQSKPAFMFLVVPFASWLLMTIVVFLPAFVSGRS